MKVATLPMILIAAGASAKTSPPSVTVCPVGCDFPTI
jgi:hypothetical protein